jgi:hypothetical protein
MTGLAAPDSPQRADSLLVLEEQRAECTRTLAKAIRKMLQSATEPAQRKWLFRALTRVTKGRVPEAADYEPLQGMLDEYAGLESRWRGALHDFDRVFKKDVSLISSAMKQLAADSRFHAAVLLQNRNAVHNHVLPYITEAGNNSNWKLRRSEHLIAVYLQRYCMKNDTIGFFGPVGWGKVIRSGKPITVIPGRNLISRSSLYFEQWCIEALAGRVADNDRVRRSIAPRLLPTVHIDQNVLRLSNGTQIAISPTQGHILQLCDGRRIPPEIARELARDNSGLPEDEVYNILCDLSARGVIGWKLQLPMAIHPERSLRKVLEQIEDESLRTSELTALAELEDARDQIAAAIEHPERLDASLGCLEDAFTRLTGQDSTRSFGQVYAGRTLVYQDCRRDMEFTIGPEILEALGAPLSLILAAARWFTYQAAQTYRKNFEAIFERLTMQTLTTTLDFLQFWAEAQECLLDPDKPLLKHIISELQYRWAEILQLPDREASVHYRSEDLRADVARLFTAPHPGWRLARYHSPDVMIAAPDIVAIGSGNYSLVLGELHMATNTLQSSSFMSQHPAPEELVAAITTDITEPRAIPVPPRSWPGLTNRTSGALYAARDYHVEISTESISQAPGSRTLPISAFVVTRSPQGLTISTRDKRVSFDVIEFLGDALSIQVADCMKIVSPRPHIPRVTIDRLTVCRQTWFFTASEIAFAQVKDESERLLAVRRWKRGHNLPRYVFVRVYLESKPIFIDLDSPILIDIVSKLVRRVIESDKPEEPILFSEMFPEPGNCWLPDSVGRKYTAELRFVAVDRTTSSRVLLTGASIA